MLQEYRVLGQGQTHVAVSLTFHAHSKDSGSYLDPLLYICDISLVRVVRFFKKVRPQLHDTAGLECW